MPTVWHLRVEIAWKESILKVGIRHQSSPKTICNDNGKTVYREQKVKSFCTDDDTKVNKSIFFRKYRLFAHKYSSRLFSSISLESIRINTEVVLQLLTDSNNDKSNNLSYRQCLVASQVHQTYEMTFYITYEIRESQWKNLKVNKVIWSTFHLSQYKQRNNKLHDNIQRWCFLSKLGMTTLIKKSKWWRNQNIRQQNLK